MKDVILKNAKPINCQAVADHYNSYIPVTVDFNTYKQTWVKWLTAGRHDPEPDKNILIGIEGFHFVDYIQGTTQAFDHFVLRHCKNRTIAVLPGEFQYHACISKTQRIEKINPLTNGLRSEHALIISLPFSGTGNMYPNFYEILEQCNKLEVPVCLDLSYWGISKNMSVNLLDYPCIQEVVSSLSKPFSVLANHRVGIRFSRKYLDDGISMINETKMQNFHSMSLGVYFMNRFPANFMWDHFGKKYYQCIGLKQFDTTETIIFARTSDQEFAEYNRGVPGWHRLCISSMLDEY